MMTAILLLTAAAALIGTASHILISQNEIE